MLKEMKEYIVIKEGENEYPKPYYCLYLKADRFLQEVDRSWCLKPLLKRNKDCSIVKTII